MNIKTEGVLRCLKKSAEKSKERDKEGGEKVKLKFTFTFQDLVCDDEVLLYFLVEEEWS